LDFLHAALLGVVQGLTEFLPVSSSGHLVLFQNLFGFHEPELFFDICLHMGTLVAIFLVFWKEILTILTTLFQLPVLVRKAGGMKPLFESNESVRIALLIIIGSIPTGILGVCFQSIADQLFSSLRIVGGMLVVTGILLWITRRHAALGRPIAAVTLKDALIIGVVQGLAIIPGVSRSGSTISAALLLGVDREVAGRYSFLLSIPAIIGALVMGLDADMLQKSSAGVNVLFLGTAMASIVGYVSLVVLMRLVKKGKLSVFAPYCWGVGTLAILYTFI
jgi:undecaprenyl-diphosphatase